MPRAREDKARRGQLTVVLGVSVGLALILARQPELVGLPGFAWALALLAGGFVLAWQGGVLARAHAMLKLRAIRAAGLEATNRLNTGDLAGARAGFGALLVTARPLGAFHAVHVLMYGVTRFCEGETKEGLALATRAIESGWFQQRLTRDVMDAAQTWRVLMLLDAGQLGEARRLVESAPKNALPTATLVLLAHENKWREALEAARAALADAAFPKAGRPTVALVGAWAARALQESAAPFEQILSNEPLGPLARVNPALRPFLPARQP